MVISVPAFASLLQPIATLITHPSPKHSSSRINVHTTLLTGRPGAGKTFATRCITTTVAPHVLPIVVDCALLPANQPHSLQTTLNLAFQTQPYSTSCTTLVLVLDQLDVLHTPLLRDSLLDLLALLQTPTRFLANILPTQPLLNSILDPLLPIDTNVSNPFTTIIVIGAAPAIADIPLQLRTAGFFLKSIELTLISATQRLQVLKHITKSFPLEVISHPDFSPGLIAAATASHGFVCADLVAIVRTVALRREGYLRKNELLNSTSTKTLDNLLYPITREDWLTAIRDAPPSALREAHLINTGSSQDKNENRLALDTMFGIDAIVTKVRSLIISPFRAVFGENMITKTVNHASSLLIPRGILITGPTGSGKTALARALISELGIPCIAVDGSAIKSKIVGESERNVARVFAQARSCAPCVILVDHIDTLAPSRIADPNASGSSLRVTTTFLVEMDGLRAKEALLAQSTNNNKTISSNVMDSVVIVVGITDTEDRVDDALLRPGRLGDVKLSLQPKTMDRSLYDAGAIVNGLIKKLSTKAPPFGNELVQRQQITGRWNVDNAIIIAQKLQLTAAQVQNGVDMAAVEALQQEEEIDNRNTDLDQNTRYCCLTAALQNTCR